MNRRWFTAMLGIGAPVAAVTQQYPPSPVLGGNLAGEGQRYIPSPMELLQRRNSRNFAKAREALSDLHYTKMRTAYLKLDEVDWNIQSLRSIAPQHKVRMQIENTRRREQENKSAIQKLMEQFGIKPDHDTDTYPQAATGNW